MNYDLFDNDNSGEYWTEGICDGAVVLRQFATNTAPELISVINLITQQSPFRHMKTTGGYTMSAALSGCGSLGWISDHAGYRYSAIDPTTGLSWPEMPAVLFELAQKAAAEAGYDNFTPDACLINRYKVGAKMSLHQDKDEQDFSAPIVSVSLGLPATFLFGGKQRSDKTIKVPLTHGDVVVWGGEVRKNFHGILPIKADSHLLLGEERINITFRVAG
ncbi:DNA oxidative demethylase AlkB [Leucothrix arctica]|uniref:DNA oxidative demethylase AlkB n=1 Tax=Leucothrix arctica TaxID=1481894 RepID=A0A317CNQ4_9GAMM|nr:DNA oxidative demethylase AlkB [Leucothrix arctica]PWQ97950.1 DNA oxidative demethylase AlkB [Leucothrix arctica]